jgi:predicted alpha/beta superfamily hydrolase
MFDGHNVFFDEDATYGKSWGMGGYLDRTDTGLIVAAVDCNHRPPHGRLNEYSPFTFEDPHFGRVTGYGRRFMRWMVETLKRLIDERYPTLPGRETTWIAGSSMGGLMSLFAVSEFNHVFSRAAALSPSVWAAQCKMEQTIRRSALGPDTVVYMDYGSEELKGQEHMRGYFQRCADALADGGAYVSSRIIPGGTHCEASWERQIPIFLPTIMYH